MREWVDFEKNAAKSNFVDITDCIRACLGSSKKKNGQTTGITARTKKFIVRSKSETEKKVFFFSSF